MSGSGHVHQGWVVMASAPPAWCKNCGAELQHGDRTGGRAREFCGDKCRQQFNRQLRLRRDLAREVGLNPAQLTRLLSLYRVTPRRRAAPES
jgi:hypothetical protein